MSKSNKTRNVAVGALFVGLLGYAAGLLTAPKSGRETRKDIQNKALQAKSEMEKRLKSLHTELDKLIAQGKKNSSKFSAAAKKDWGVAVESAIVARDKLKTVLSAIHEGDAEDKDLKKALKQAEEAVENLKAFLAKDLPKAAPKDAPAKK